MMIYLFMLNFIHKLGNNARFPLVQRKNYRCCCGFCGVDQNSRATGSGAA
jgi:hypothetical protein